MWAGLVKTQTSGGVSFVDPIRGGCGKVCSMPGPTECRKNSVVPPGLESFSALFPALKRWANLGCPSEA
jgi:hypothetical protein